jgi:hypothetical protein
VSLPYLSAVAVTDSSSPSVDPDPETVSKMGVIAHVTENDEQAVFHIKAAGKSTFVSHLL